MASFWEDDGGEFDPFEPMSQTTALGGSQHTQQQQQPYSQASAATTTSSGAAAAAAAFVCENCGGREYEFLDNDEDGARMVCTTCYTESTQPSQVLTAQNSQLDYEDVMGLAAKTRSGGLVSRKVRAPSSGPSSTARKSTRLPLEPLNTAVPFPDFITLVTAFQTVLHVCTDRLVTLMHRPSRNDPDVQRRVGKRRTCIHETVRTLWSTYLGSWSQGAEYYGEMYPTVRFSLRDEFFSIRKRIMIINTIVGRYELEQRQKLLQEQQSQQVGDPSPVHEEDLLRRALREEAEGEKIDVSLGQREIDTSDGSDVDPMLDDDEDDSSRYSSDDDAGGSGSDDEDISTQRKKSPYTHSKIRLVVRQHTKNAPKTARDVALLVPPSMSFAAALMWLAVSESGLVPISTYCHWISTAEIPLANAFKILPEEQQTKVDACASFFRLKWSPSPDSLRQLATSVAVACRLKAQHAPEDRTDQGPDGNARLGFVTQHTAPLVLAQVVGDLQFGQAVLDRSLAILADVRDHPPTRMDHLAAIVALAVLMEPGWRTWRIVRRSNASGNGANNPMIIPANDGHVRLLRNGPEVDAYLAFAEKYVLTGESVHPRIDELKEQMKSVDFFPNRCDPSDDRDIDGSSKAVVRPCLDVVRLDTMRATPPDGFEGRDGSRRCSDFSSKMLRAKSRSSRIEIDPQASVIIELIAQAVKMETLCLHAAVMELLDELSKENDRKRSAPTRPNRTKKLLKSSRQ